MALDFIRYFAVTNDSPIGKAAQSYLVSLLRIAPVRLLSRSGFLEGSWRKFESLLMTPMTGLCASCVCTAPAGWIEEISVPMPKANLGAQGAATAPSAPQLDGTAKGAVELYTPPGPGRSVLRNVLFMVDAPITNSQHRTAARYEAVIMSTPDPFAVIARTWPEQRFESTLVPIPITPEGHGRIREAVTGVAPAPSENVYR